MDRGGGAGVGKSNFGQKCYFRKKEKVEKKLSLSLFEFGPRARYSSVINPNGFADPDLYQYETDLQNCTGSVSYPSPLHEYSWVCS